MKNFKIMPESSNSSLGVVGGVRDVYKRMEVKIESVCVTKITV